jgi:(2Fe-2S) ferredoxin
MGKKRKLRKSLHKREIDDTPALVICVGKSCAPREVSRQLAEQTRAYADASGARVRVAVLGCLHVCKKGPVVATWPDIEFHKRVDFTRACRLVDELAAEAKDVSDTTCPIEHAP